MRKFRLPLVIALSSIILLGLVIYGIVSDVDEIFLTQSSPNQNLTTFEVGSQTELNHFKEYFALTPNNTAVEDWLKKMGDDRKIEIKNGKIIFLDDISIPSLFKNTCKRVYCFQSRTPFAAIPANLWKAVIGTEDIRFLEHKGVDLKSIARAIWVDLKEMKFVQGGSTLTQQLVKNLFLTNEKSFKRKIKEMIIAIYVEYRYSKEQILQAYLNEQMWGSINGIRILGHQAASLFYFNKPSKELDEIEATALISMLKGPYYYHPLKHLDRLIVRTRAQFEKLVEKDLYYSKKSDFWEPSKWIDWQQRLQVKADLLVLRDFYLTTSNKKFTSQFETFTWYRGISYVSDVLKKRIGNKDFAFKVFRKEVNCKDCDAFKIYSKFEKKLDESLATERHQIGSIFKPVVYQNFLNEGYKKTKLISTADIELSLKSGKWAPRDSKTEETELTLERALQLSKNHPFIRLCSEYGFEHIETYLKRLNVPNLKTPLGEYPAQLLGALELSVTEVAQVYMRFLGNVCERVSSNLIKFEDSVLSILSDPTRTTIAKIVKSDLSHIKFFGKTGTSNNGNDTWFVSYDGSHLTVIWGGVETKREDSKTLISGASSAFRLYQFFVRNSARRPKELGCY